MEPIDCRWCGKVFQPNPPNQKYCSAQCWKEFRLKYNREFMRKNYAKYKEQNQHLHTLWRKKHPEKMKEYYRRRKAKWGKQDMEKKKEYMKKYSKRYRCVKYMGLSSDLYDKMTRRCAIKDCEFFLTVDLHHIDTDKTNNNLSNLIGLCPSHHQLIHRHDYGLEQDGDAWILTK